MDFQTKIVQNNAFHKYHRRLITFKHLDTNGRSAFHFENAFAKT